MDDSVVRQYATAHDPSRTVATALDTDYVLTIERVADRDAKAGHPRTIRTLQRYCAKGHFSTARKRRPRSGARFTWSRHNPWLAKPANRAYAVYEEEKGKGKPQYKK